MGKVIFTLAVVLVAVFVLVTEAQATQDSLLHSDTRTLGTDRTDELSISQINRFIQSLNVTNSYRVNDTGTFLDSNGVATYFYAPRTPWLPVVEAEPLSSRPDRVNSTERDPHAVTLSEAWAGHSPHEHKWQIGFVDETTIHGNEGERLYQREDEINVNLMEIKF